MLIHQRVIFPSMMGTLVGTSTPRQAGARRMPDPASTRNVQRSAQVTSRYQVLLNELSGVEQLVRQSVPILDKDETVDIIRPASIDTLLDRSASDPEQNLPYWAEIWPSGLGLGAEIIDSPDLVAGQPVLELGSGVGITAAIALACDAHLVATDYATEAITLTRMTCLLHTGREPETRQLNWRVSDADILQSNGSRWPVVMAADVLYEQRDIEPILDIFSRLVAPDGFIWFAEQGRRPGLQALETLADRGWRISSKTITAEWPDPKDAGVIVHVHKLRPPFVKH